MDRLFRQQPYTRTRYRVRCKTHCQPAAWLYRRNGLGSGSRKPRSLLFVEIGRRSFVNEVIVVEPLYSAGKL